MSDVWASWVPATGQRVKIRRSAECPHSAEFLHAEPIPDGSVGEVYQLFEETQTVPAHDGHGIFVAFEADGEGRRISGWFAAVELELVQ